MGRIAGTYGVRGWVKVVTQPETLAAQRLWWIGGAEQIRLYLLDAPAGGNVVIGVDAIDTDFLTLIEVSDPVVQSIYFDMGSY